MSSEPLRAEALPALATAHAANKANTAGTTDAAARHAPRWFAAGLMLGLVAEQTVLFAVPLIVYQQTGSVAYSGIAFAAEWIPALLAYPFAGLLADRLGGRHLFLRANLARAACLLLALAACAAAPAATVVLLMINGMLLSALVAPIRMAVEKTVPMLARQATPAAEASARAGPGSPPGSAPRAAKRDPLSRLQSLVQNVELMAMALGPAIAAGLAHGLGKLALLAVAGGAFVLAAACWRPLPAGPRQPAADRRIGHDLLLGWRLLLGNRPVLMLAVLNFSINLAFALALSANAYLVTGVFGAADGVFGLMNAGAGAVGLLNLLLIPRLLASSSIEHLGACGFALMCLGLWWMGGAATAWAYVPAFLAAMAGAAWFNVFNRTQRVKVIEPEHLGKVIGPFYLVNCLSYPIAGFITAGLGNGVGVQNLLLAMAAVLSLPGGLLLWHTARSFRLRLEALAAPAPLPHCSSKEQVGTLSR